MKRELYSNDNHYCLERLSFDTVRAPEVRAYVLTFHTKQRNRNIVFTRGRNLQLIDMFRRLLLRNVKESKEENSMNVGYVQRARLIDSFHNENSAVFWNPLFPRTSCGVSIGTRMKKGLRGTGSSPSMQRGTRK